MMKHLILAILVGSMGSHAADVRTWSTPDGSGTFRGEYLSHDDKTVTIRREDNKVFTVALAKLHADDKSWLSSLNKPSEPESEPAPDPNAVFDTLRFGDGVETVKKKLKASKRVETSLDDTYLGRTGLNGIYRTRQDTGGLQGELFFSWSPADTLAEIALHTRPQAAEAYTAELKVTWTKYAELLTACHGSPIQGGGYPGINRVKDGMFQPTHLWKLRGGSSVQLGISMVGDRYLVVVNFTKQSIQPVGVL